MSRLAPLELDDMTPEQRAVAEAIVAGPRGRLRGPFPALLRSPELADLAQQMGAYCRYGTSLSPNLSELAMVITGKRWTAQFEFWAHSSLAIEAGVPPEAIEAIRTGAVPEFTDPGEQLVYDLVTEYLDTSRVSDATYTRALDLLGERGVLDVVGIIGYYTLVSAVLNVFDVSTPEGVEPPLPE